MHCKSYSHFFSKKFQHIYVSLNVNFNESLTNDVVSFEQLGPVYHITFKLYFMATKAEPFFFPSENNVVTDGMLTLLASNQVLCNMGSYHFMMLFVCVEVLQPSQPNGVRSSVVRLPNHTFTGQA